MNKVILTDAVPDIEKYWDYEANEGKKPSDFGASSSEKVWTKCPICGTSVKRNIRYTWEKDKNGVGHVIHCRTCGKRNNNNSLVVLFPDIKNIGYMRRTNTTQNTILFLPARKYIPVVLAAGKKDILPYAISLSKEMTDMNLRNALNVLQKGM